jgi:hypothetical protein
VFKRAIGGLAERTAHMRTLAALLLVLAVCGMIVVGCKRDEGTTGRGTGVSGTGAIGGTPAATGTGAVVPTGTTATRPAGTGAGGTLSGTVPGVGGGTVGGTVRTDSNGISVTGNVTGTK